MAVLIRKQNLTSLDDGTELFSGFGGGGAYDCFEFC